MLKFSLIALVFQKQKNDTDRYNKKGGGLNNTETHKIETPFQMQLHPPRNSVTSDLLDFSLSIY